MTCGWSGSWRHWAPHAGTGPSPECSLGPPARRPCRRPAYSANTTRTTSPSRRGRSRRGRPLPRNRCLRRTSPRLCSARPDELNAPRARAHCPVSLSPCDERSKPSHSPRFVRLSAAARQKQRCGSNPAALPPRTTGGSDTWPRLLSLPRGPQVNDVASSGEAPAPPPGGRGRRITTGFARHPSRPRGRSAAVCGGRCRICGAWPSAPPRNLCGGGVGYVGGRGQPAAKSCSPKGRVAETAERRGHPWPLGAARRGALWPAPVLSSVSYEPGDAPCWEDSAHRPDSASARGCAGGDSPGRMGSVTRPHRSRSGCRCRRWTATTARGVAATGSRASYASGLASGNAPRHGAAPNLGRRVALRRGRG